MIRLCIVFTLVLSGCLGRPGWHWEKSGAGDAEYTSDLNRCKGSSYSGADGLVTQEMVRRMHACMEARGWRKAND